MTASQGPSGETSGGSEDRGGVKEEPSEQEVASLHTS